MKINNQQNKKRSKRQREQERLKHANTYNEGFKHGYKIAMQELENKNNKE